MSTSNSAPPASMPPKKAYTIAETLPPYSSKKDRSSTLPLSMMTTVLSNAAVTAASMRRSSPVGRYPPAAFRLSLSSPAARPMSTSATSLRPAAARASAQGTGISL